VFYYDECSELFNIDRIHKNTVNNIDILLRWFVLKHNTLFQVKHCRLPSLVVALTLHHCQDHVTHSSSQSGTEGEGLSDVVGFVIGLLLGSDPEVRIWFSEFIRNGQKVKYTYTLENGSYLPISVNRIFKY
jgi:hypothetical protein